LGGGDSNLAWFKSEVERAGGRGERGDNSENHLSYLGELKKPTKAVRTKNSIRILKHSRQEERGAKRRKKEGTLQETWGPVT